MFGRLLRGYTIYIYIYIHIWRLLLRNGILPGAKFSLRPPSLALSYWQGYCTALEHWARAKLCGVEHMAPCLYSAGRPSLWALAHILVHNLADPFAEIGILAVLINVISRPTVTS